MVVKVYITGFNAEFIGRIKIANQAYISWDTLKPETKFTFHVILKKNLKTYLPVQLI